ncbi:MAG: cyclic nucleotide-binding domain-containing protein [Deltaproteobacteria bacterium]|nr:cyclic nucleotide-binding domain-containing protein [Deltaproteobacteria bacterium]
MADPAPKKKLPVVADSAAKPKGGKADKLKAGGWAAFSDAGSAPRVILAARVVMLVAFAATIPIILGVRHGNRILWTMAIAGLPLFWTVVGYHVWRRICPLAVVAQLGRIVGRPGTRKAGDWLAKNYLYVQLGTLVTALAIRLVAINGSPIWLAGFLVLVVVIAGASSFVFAGKTWCNYLCPVGIVEKIHTEPSASAHGQGELTSQCAPCVACKKHCPDIDIEQGYWKEMPEPPRRLAYFVWPGVVVGFYCYYWLVAHTWDYYWSGAWAYETNQASLAFDPGFWFLPQLPRIVAAPLTLVVFGAVSAAIFWAIERGMRGALVRRVAPDDTAKRGELALLARHRTLALAGFTAFNAFYFFAGQPTLRQLPGWVVTGWGGVVVFASAAIFFRRWGRRESDFVQERFAEKILKKWEWGDAPPSDNLSDIYLLHNERAKQKETRLRVYKETVRELVADGTVTRAELVILDSLRAQLGVTDKDHQKVIAELSDEERQLFDPAYQGSVELRLHRQQYQRDLERIVMEAARAGRAPSPGSLEALRRDHQVTAAEEAAALAAISAADGPVTALFHGEVAGLVTLADAALVTRPEDAAAATATESASRSLVHHLVLWRGRQHLGHALGMLGALGKASAETARQAIVESSAPPHGALAPLEGDAFAAPLVAAATRLWSAGAGRPMTAPPILAIADDGSAYLRAAAVLLLSRFDDEPARARAIAAMDDPEPMVREAAVRSLGSRSRLTRDLLTKALGDKESRVRQAAVRAVSGTTSQDLPAVDPAALAQTVKGVGNAGLYATLDANARMDTLTAIEKMMLLRQVPMFADLDPDDLDQLAALVEERHYQVGQDLCAEGDAGDAVFLLVKGRVRVFKGAGADERTLSELGPGACIGEMAVFDAAPRSATVRALERARVLVVPGEGFKALLVDRPEMSQAIIAELVRRMRGLIASAAPAR